MQQSWVTGVGAKLHWFRIVRGQAGEPVITGQPLHQGEHVQWVCPEAGNPQRRFPRWMLGASAVALNMAEHCALQ
jgi:hypothetical protein